MRQGVPLSDCLRKGKGGTHASVGSHADACRLSQCVKEMLARRVGAKSLPLSTHCSMRVYSTSTRSAFPRIQGGEHQVYSSAPTAAHASLYSPTTPSPKRRLQRAAHPSEVCCVQE